MVNEQNVLRLSSWMYYVKNSPRKNRLEFSLRFSTVFRRHGSFDKYVYFPETEIVKTIIYSSPLKYASFTNRTFIPNLQTM